MGFKLNLTNEEIKAAQGNRYAPLPKGTYGAVIFSNTFGNSKSSGNPMFTMEFKITEGQAGINRKIRGYFVLSGKALFKIVEVHKALGFDYPNPKTGAGEFEFPEVDEYIGEKVNIVLDLEDYASEANDDDVEDGTILNSETGEPVTEAGEPVTKQRNTLRYVRKFDESKISEEGEESESTGSNSGLFL